MPTLDWLGKNAMVNHHDGVLFHLLKRDNKLSMGDPGSSNLVVQGDNLLALRVLLPYYARQRKYIYIASLQHQQLLANLRPFVLIRQHREQERLSTNCPLLTANQIREWLPRFEFV